MLVWKVEYKSRLRGSPKAVFLYQLNKKPSGTQLSPRAFLMEEMAMPRKPKKPCAFPGCPLLTQDRYCEEHRKKVNRDYNNYERSPEAKKRYGRAWKRIRDSYVKTHPLCELCLKEGKYTPVERFITLFLWPKVAHTTEQIYSACVNPATADFMPNAATDGERGREYIAVTKRYK